MNDILQLDSLKKFPELTHGIATAEFGNMSFRYGEPDEVRQNRLAFFDELSVPPEQTIVTSLIHGHTIIDVSENDRGRGIAEGASSLEGDILATDKPDTFLFLVVADCLALFFYEPSKQVCALAHAGWRGVEQNVPRLTVDHLVRHYGCNPAEIKVGLSPALQGESSLFTQPDHLVVQDRARWTPYLTPIGPKLQVNWVDFAVDQLLEAGIAKENIENTGIDTLTDSRFFSHRRSHQDHQPEARFGCLIGFRTR